MRVFEFNRAIVRLPGRSIVDGLKAGAGEGPDFETVAAEHSLYVHALDSAGLGLIVLPALEAYPDSVFVEDPALVFREGAILLRPGAASRRGESAMLAPVLAEHFDPVLALTAGSVDGGDVLVTPQAVYIGLSDRTDPSGAEALVALLARLGRKGIVVDPPRGTLHLKSAASLVDEETVLVTASLASVGLFDGLRNLVVPEGEEPGANVVRINDVVLAGSRWPRTADLLDGHGLEIVALPTGEIGKIDAGLSCMSLRWWADGPVAP